MSNRGQGSFKGLYISIGLVTVLVASGILIGKLFPQQILIPNLQGYSQSAAVKEIKSVGLIPVVELVSIKTGIKQGLVVSTDPPAGEKVEPGASIQINVSDSPEEDSGNNSSEVAPPWYPEGFVKYSETLAYQWITGGPSPCSGFECKYNTLNVITKTGCPSGVYAEVNYLNSGAIVDWSNDSVPSLERDQVAQLQFQTFDRSPVTAELVKISCH